MSFVIKYDVTIFKIIYKKIYPTLKILTAHHLLNHGIQLLNDWWTFDVNFFDNTASTQMLNKKGYLEYKKNATKILAEMN